MPQDTVYKTDDLIASDIDAYLDVHQHTIEWLSKQEVNRFTTVVGDRHLMSAFDQQCDSQLLVVEAVFGQ